MTFVDRLGCAQLMPLWMEHRTALHDEAEALAEFDQRPWSWRAASAYEQAALELERVDIMLNTASDNCAAGGFANGFGIGVSWSELGHVWASVSN